MTICAHGGPRRTAALALLVVLAILPAAAAGSAPALSVRYGTPVTFLLPQVAAMGGTGTAVYRGGLSGVLNPAMLSRETGWRVDAAAAVTEAHEDRFVPLYDTFGDYVTETAIATNRHNYWKTGFGVAHGVPWRFGNLAYSLALADRYDFSYDFVEELRNPDPFAANRDELLQNRRVEIDGTLRALSGGVASEVTPWWSLGLSVNYNFGTRKEVLALRDYEDPTASELAREEFDMDGVNFVLGSRTRIGQRIEVGLAYETPLEVDGNVLQESASGTPGEIVSRGVGEATVKYPRRWRAGVAFYPRNEPRTVFTVEAELSEWSELEDDRLPGDNPLLLRDTVDARVGVEHLFYNGMAARFGFRHLGNYADRDYAMSFFTGGIGWQTAGGQVSASVELGKMQSVEPHWFPYPDDGVTYVTQPVARVETTEFRFGLGYTRAF